MRSDRSFVTTAPAGTSFLLDTVQSREEGSTIPVPSKERTDVGKDTVNNFEWKYEARGKKRLIVNGMNILAVELDRRGGDSSEIITLDRSQSMLNVSSSGVDSVRIGLLPSGLFR